MKKTTFCICLLIFSVLAMNAQMVRYPFQKEMKAGDYKAVKASIDKELKKNPKATGVNYTAYKLCMIKTYKGYSLEKAYSHLVASWDGFKAMDGEERAKAERNGFNDDLYTIGLEFVCKIIYDELLESEPTEEQLDSFLMTYTLAPEEIKMDVEKRRDQMRRSAAKGSGSRVEYCNMLKQNPVGDWVAGAKRDIYNEAMQGMDIELMECVAEMTKGDEREKLMEKIHAIWVSGPSLQHLDSMYSLYERFNSSTLKKYKDADLKRAEAEKRANDKVSKGLIDSLAPYNIGMMYMARYLDQMQKNGDAASKIAAALESFKAGYGSNPWYKTMAATMSAKISGEIKPEKLSEKVNSGGHEYSPYISADDNTLYFVGKKRVDNLGGEDIFYAERDENGQWKRPLQIRSINTERGNEAVEAVSVDGEDMIVFKNGKFYTTRRHGTTWGKLEQMPKSVNMASWQADATLTSDGKAMLFAARTNNGREIGTSENLYVSLKQADGTWGKAIELGPKVNTAFNERAPFMHPDMKTLYFSSDGHGSTGSYDVWMTRRLNDEKWTEWSEPVNLGREVNSGEMECWYKISTDGQKAYFSKGIESGNEDIYIIDLPVKMRPEGVTIITGHLKDRKGKYLEGVIRWEDLETGRDMGEVRTSSVDGKFFIVLPMGRNYGYYVDKEGYYPVANWIDLRNRKDVTKEEHDIEMVSYEEMMNEDAAVPLNNLFFETAKSDLLPASRFELDRVAYILKNMKSIRVEISGHTDSNGDRDKNQRLSEDRCRSVRDYLISKGCKYEMFTIIGYGPDKPRATNETAEGRQLNRRVELRIRR